MSILPYRPNPLTHAGSQYLALENEHKRLQAENERLQRYVSILESKLDRETLKECIAQRNALSEGQVMNDDELKELESLYPQAVEFAKSEASMSISKLQRKFMIGYNRAARMIERLAADGVLTFDNMTGAYSRAVGKESAHD